MRRAIAGGAGGGVKGGVGGQSGHVPSGAVRRQNQSSRSRPSSSSLTTTSTLTNASGGMGETTPASPMRRRDLMIGLRGNGSSDISSV